MQVRNLSEVAEHYDLHAEPGREHIIASPGKFEGEPAYAPFYWDAWLDGFGDSEYQDGVYVSIFNVDSEDRARFPGLLDEVERIELWDDSNGFVHTATFSVCPNCDVSHHGAMGALCTGCSDAARGDED